MKRTPILYIFMFVFVLFLFGCNSFPTKRNTTTTTINNKEETTTTSTSKDTLSFSLSEDESYYIVSGKDGLDYDSLIIPESYKNKPVEEIKENAFKDNKTIKSVYIPSSISKIGDKAFDGCEAIERVDIKDLESWLKIYFVSVTSNPLYYAHNLYIDNELLTKLEIPESIGVLKQYAFAGCASLKEAIIPKTVALIGYGPFVHCSSIESMTIPFIGREIYTPKNRFLFSYFFVVNPSKTSSNMGSVPSSLKKVTLLSGPEAIRSDQFSSCSSIEEIILPNSIKQIGTQAFSSCDSLVSITIPDGVTSIGSEAFSSCRSLVSITLGSRVREIRDYAFYFSPKITEIVNKSSLELEIGSSEFGGIALNAKNIITDETDSKLHTVDDKYILYEDDNDVTLVQYIGNETNVSIPNNVTIIGNHSFNKFSGSNLESVIIPEGVKKIESSAFYFCSNLKEVTIPETLEEIESSAFYQCNNVRINISSMESWCNIKFYNYGTNPLNNMGSLYLNDELLEDIIIPDGVTKINDNAFSGYKFIKSITIPSSVEIVGDFAFYYCLNLNKVTLNSGLKSINRSAFYMCSTLDEIFIPKTIEEISSSAFEGCMNLSKIYYFGTIDEWNLVNGISYLSSKTIYYYSETEPDASGNFWHLVDGIITEW